MPFIRSLASERCAYMAALIFLLSEIMPTCSRCLEKRLLYITIVTPSSRQPSSYFKCIKANIRSLCDVYLVFNNEYAFLICFNSVVYT